MTHRPRRRRPPILVGAWAALLVATVSLGILGQVGEGRGDRPPTPAAAVPPVATQTLLPAPRPAALPASATRPPIGEDGVMGGLVFGTAFGWLEPRAGDP